MKDGWPRWWETQEEMGAQGWSQKGTGAGEVWLWASSTGGAEPLRVIGK